MKPSLRKATVVDAAPMPTKTSQDQSAAAISRIKNTPTKIFPP